MTSRKNKIQFSIIIPSRNRASYLKECLQCIARFDYSKNSIEVVVVNNDSYDNTAGVVNSFVRLNPNLKVRLLTEHRIGPSNCRNLGISQARSHFVVCIDDDVLPPVNLLSIYSDILKRTPDAALISGKVIATSNNGVSLKRFLKILSEDSWVFSQTNRNEKKITQLTFPDDLISASILINRKIVREKVFSKVLGREYKGYYIGAEDTELSLFLLQEGKKLLYDPSIVSRHIIGEEKLNYKYILNRFFRAGIEHKLIDQEFASRGVRFYKFNVKFFLRIVMEMLKSPNLRNLLKIIREILFFVGYYYPLKGSKAF